MDGMDYAFDTETVSNYQKSREDKQCSSWSSSRLCNESFVVQCSEVLFPEFRTDCLRMNYSSSNNLKIGKSNWNSKT